jgi:O-acetyl-ADP-ribose deacetylase (regulator of RNase III)
MNIVETTPLPDDELLPAKIVLIDRSPQLVEEWRRVFGVFQEIEVLAGDYFQRPADAIVSPANSFGIMDGGLDLAIRNVLGDHVETRVQKAILARHHGELPVGSAEIVATDHQRWPFLVSAPTMRVPESVAHTINPYLAFRAALVAVENHNRQAATAKIATLVCCGLGTGVGGVSSSRCATQMLLAYKNMLAPPMRRRFESIHELHQALRMS